MTGFHPLSPAFCVQSSRSFCVSYSTEEKFSFLFHFQCCHVERIHYVTSARCEMIESPLTNTLLIDKSIFIKWFARCAHNMVIIIKKFHFISDFSSSFLCVCWIFGVERGSSSSKLLHFKIIHFKKNSNEATCPLKKCFSLKLQNINLWGFTENHLCIKLHVHITQRVISFRVLFEN